MTALAKDLLEPIPAHRTVGIEVVRAADGAAVVAAGPWEAMANVIGSLHSSGLVALVDATGLAALIAADPRNGFAGLLPLGRAAALEFLAPARGRLVATCGLSDSAREALEPLWSRDANKVRVSTEVDVADASGHLVCRGRFDWSVRRTDVG